ncbi:U-scoloptoxin(19)-Sm1a isoform X2 [Aedes albopictus]|uniref:Secreted protein n=1 Tax=Aedes albopictus TaxID=7160 RepID=A0ABM1XIT8_AEDAL
MKFNLFTLLLVVAFVCACHGAEIPPPTVPENGDVVRTYQGVNVYKTERACARQGGLCVQKDDCKSLTAIKGLCPENANRGVECCYEVKPPRMNMTCADHQGECMANCNAVWLIRPANDCANGETCCILVR